MLQRISLLALTSTLLSAICTEAPAAPAAQTNTAPTLLSTAADANSVVARGRGFQITRHQLDQEVARAVAQVEAKGRPLYREEMAQVPRQVLEQLINVQLIESKATAADRVAGKEQAQKRLAQARAQAGSEQAFTNQLSRLGTTQPELLAKWTEALTADSVIKRDIKVTVTDQDVRKEYDSNTNQFQAPDMIRIRHILIATLDRQTGAAFSPDVQAAKRKQADAVLKRARAGEDFTKLVAEFSDDSVSKDKGGEYTFGHGDMLPEVETASLALKPGQVSDVITSPYGYHIVKLEQKIPAHQIKFADAAPDIKAALVEDAIQKQFPDYIAKLRKEAAVEILDPKLLPIVGVDPNQYLKPIPGFQDKMRQ
ncbi:MAG TPA: peptidylprolyl isomerase [Candidatus Acidoferrum sp.]|nr:peptidylprolyl isomerase [Candidatus Acidoferrum sp.]